MTRINLIVLVVACSVAQAQTAPTIHINDGANLPDFDAGWGRGSMIPIQDPIFTEI